MENICGTNLEKKLKNRKIIYCIIAAFITLAAFAAIAVSGFVFENKVAVIVSLCCGIAGLFVLWLCLRIKVKSATVDGQKVTLYKFLGARLYIDGKQVDKSAPFCVVPILEGALKGGVHIKINARSMFPMGEISDSRPPVELL